MKSHDNWRALSLEKNESLQAEYNSSLARNAELQAQIDGDR